MSLMDGGLLIFFWGMITFCCVWATSMNVNQFFSASTSQIVKDVPSTQTNPLGTMYFIEEEGTWTYRYK